MDVPSMQLLLASKSPRRRQLLASIDIPVTTVEIDVEEHLSSPVPAAEVAERLALLKAQGYTQPLEEGQVLVAADTVVVHRDSVLGKPHSEQEAYAMLRALSGD
ncbi:MAG: Maf family protein, partial [Bacteroidales bacterium]|nr:Maf family protein [Bacteroidales bacterium]